LLVVCCDLLIALDEVIPNAADPNSAVLIAAVPIAVAPLATSLIELDSDADYRSRKVDLTRGEFDWMELADSNLSAFVASGPKAGSNRKTAFFPKTDLFQRNDCSRDFESLNLSLVDQSPYYAVALVA
jgi:hypothetical protein